MTRLYTLTAALLVVHEIDSAYWREWDLFGLPGGVGLFLAIHVPLALLVLWGQARVAVGARAGVWMSILVGGAGVATAGIHGALLARGGTAFRTAPSLALIAATAVSALALLGAAAGQRRGGAAPQ